MRYNLSNYRALNVNKSRIFRLTPIKNTILLTAISISGLFLGYQDASAVTLVLDSNLETQDTPDDLEVNLNSDLGDRDTIFNLIDGDILNSNFLTKISQDRQENFKANLLTLSITTETNNRTITPHELIESVVNSVKQLELNGKNRTNNSLESSSVAILSQVNNGNIYQDVYDFEIDLVENPPEETSKPRNNSLPGDRKFDDLITNSYSDFFNTASSSKNFSSTNKRSQDSLYLGGTNNNLPTAFNKSVPSAIATPAYIQGQIAEEQTASLTTIVTEIKAFNPNKYQINNLNTYPKTKEQEELEKKLLLQQKKQEKQQEKLREKIDKMREDRAKRREQQAELRQKKRKLALINAQKRQEKRQEAMQNSLLNN
ncbi:MAG: hypothetical protein Tsb0014_36210 [Pleurocapsa sp.]